MYANFWSVHLTNTEDYTWTALKVRQLLLGMCDAEARVSGGSHVTSTALPDEVLGYCFVEAQHPGQAMHHLHGYVLTTWSHQTVERRLEAVNRHLVSVSKEALPTAVAHSIIAQVCETGCQAAAPSSIQGFRHRTPPEPAHTAAAQSSIQGFRHRTPQEPAQTAAAPSSIQGFRDSGTARLQNQLTLQQHNQAFRDSGTARRKNQLRLQQHNQAFRDSGTARRKNQLTLQQHHQAFRDSGIQAPHASRTSSHCSSTIKHSGIQALHATRTRSHCSSTIKHSGIQALHATRTRSHCSSTIKHSGISAGCFVSATSDAPCEHQSVSQVCSVWPAASKKCFVQLQTHAHPHMHTSCKQLRFVVLRRVLV
jgi:hypothetical protein